MRRRLNLKFLGILLGVAALFATGAHFLHAFQVKRNASVLLSQADKAKVEGDFPKAVGYLGRYVTLVPGDTQAYAKFALLLADEKVAKSARAWFYAYERLEEAVRRDGKRSDVRRRLVEVAMSPWLQRHSDAGTHLDKLLGPTRSDGELLNLRGQCHQAGGQNKEARECFESAIKQRPKDTDTYVRLAYLLREHAAKVKKGEKSVEEVLALADATMEAMVKADAGSFEVYLKRAHYRKAVATPAEAATAAKAVEADVLKAQQLAPDKAEVILAVAALVEENARPEEARAGLRKGLARYPKDWRLYQALARLEVRQGRRTEARNCLKEGLAKLPDQIDLLWNMAYLLTEKEHQDEVTGAIGRLRAAGFPKADLDYLTARLLVADEKWLQASRLLEGAYPQLLSRNSLRKDWFSFNLAQDTSLLLGFCYEQLGDADRAASAFGRVLIRAPRSEQAHHGLARMRWALGQLGAAADQYRQLVELPNAPRVAWIELAQLLIVRNLQATQPDWSEVQQVLDMAGKLVPPPVEAPLLRMEVLAALNDFGGARKALVKDHADKETRPVEIWVGLSNLEARQGQAKTALAVLDEAEKQLGDRIELRLARAGYWARHPGDDARQALAKLTDGLDKLKADDRRRLLRRVAGAYFDIGAAMESEALWRLLAKQNPNDIGSRLVLFDLRASASDDPGMQQLTRDVEQIEGKEGALWRYCESRLLISRAERGDKKGLAQARDLLDTVAKRRPGWPRVHVAQGQVEDLLGRGSAALARYREAIALGERNPAVIGRLVQLLSERQLYGEAEQLVQKLQAQKAPLGDLDRVAAEIALRKQDTVEAVRLAQKAVPADAKDFRRQVWLGQVLWAAGQLPEAESSFRRAIALAEKEPYPRVAHVQFLMATKEKAKAEAAVREAERQLPRDVAPLALAQCCQLLGDKDRAGKLYDEALAARPDDAAVLRGAALFHLTENRRDKAKAYFEQIIDLKASTPNEVKSARRALALVMASTGDYRESQKALTILGLLDEVAPVESAEPEGIERERTRAVILSKQPGVRQRRQAAALLEGLLRRQLLKGAEKFLLIQVYESIGEAKKAHSQMLSLLAATEEKLEGTPKGKAPLQQAYGAYLAHAVQSSLRDKRLNEAQLWAAKLEALEPNTFRALTAKARVLAKQGQAADAVPALKKLAAGDEDLIRPVAAVLEQVGQTEAAQEVYEHFAAKAKRPEDVLTLAAFFARQKQPEKALTLCERAWPTCRPEAVGETAMLVVYTAKLTDPQCERVAGWLEGAITKHPEKSRLLDQLAAVRRFQGRHQDTIALCRRIVDKDKVNIVAINNLAWLLVMTGQGAEALTTIERAIELGGPRAEWLDTRAVVYLTLGQSKKAVTDLEEAIAETPTAHRYFHLAQAYHQAKDQKAAVRALQQARALGLSETSIDPLEQTAYRQLLAALDRK